MFLLPQKSADTEYSERVYCTQPLQWCQYDTFLFCLAATSLLNCLVDKRECSVIALNQLCTGRCTCHTSETRLTTLELFTDAPLSKRSRQTSRLGPYESAAAKRGVLQPYNTHYRIILDRYRTRKFLIFLGHTVFWRIYITQAFATVDRVDVSVECSLTTSLEWWLFCTSRLVWTSSTLKRRRRVLCSRLHHLYTLMQPLVGWMCLMLSLD